MPMRAAWTGRVLLATIAALSVAVAAAGWLRIKSDTKRMEHFIEVGRDAYVLAAPDAIVPFRLVRHDGQVFDERSLAGGWTFLFFGFTHCPDVCPNTLAALRDIRRKLAEQPGGARDVRFVLVTVDPERDTPPVLREYLAAFDASFIGVTGEPAELARLAGPVGVTYERLGTATGQGYHMDHSSAVLLVDPRGRLHGVLAAPHSAASMTQAFATIRARARAKEPA